MDETTERLNRTFAQFFQTDRPEPATFAYSAAEIAAIEEEHTLKERISAARTAYHAAKPGSEAAQTAESEFNAARAELNARDLVSRYMTIKGVRSWRGLTSHEEVRAAAESAQLEEESLRRSQAHDDLARYEGE